MSDESIVCVDYPNCDREHAGGAGGVPVHPPEGARVSGDEPLTPAEPMVLVCACGCKLPIEVARASARANPGYLNEYQAEASVRGKWVPASEVKR